MIEKYNKYRCSDCGYEEKAPDFVIDEFATVERLKLGNMQCYRVEDVLKNLTVLIKCF